jgi:hypothetical protein
MAIKFSVRFAMILLILHILAVILVRSLLIFLSLIYYFARDVFLVLPESWQMFSLDHGVVSIVTGNGSKFSGRVANCAFVSPYFIVLLIKREGHILLDSRVVFPDSLSKSMFREICIRLKFS